MAWLDLGLLLSDIHVNVALTLLGTLALLGARATPNRAPQRRHALARVRGVKRPTIE